MTFLFVLIFSAATFQQAHAEDLAASSRHEALLGCVRAATKGVPQDYEMVIFNRLAGRVSFEKNRSAVKTERIVNIKESCSDILIQTDKEKFIHFDLEKGVGTVEEQAGNRRQWIYRFCKSFAYGSFHEFRDWLWQFQTKDRRWLENMGQ